MKYIDIIKVCSILFLIGFLYAFSSNKNDSRSINGIKVKILNDEKLLITSKMVKNLLIENISINSNKTKGTLSLGSIENYLKSNKLIAQADVHTSPSGILHVYVTQRIPILRVLGYPTFYIDSLGQKMPLSKVSSPRVPIFFGWKKSNNIREAYLLGRYIKKDHFLTELVTGVWKDGNDYMLSVRTKSFDIRLGKVAELEGKFFRFKAFYQRALKEKSLNKYREINLKYKRQVVCKIK